MNHRRPILIQCLGHSESDDPLGTPALGMKLFGFVLVSLIIPLLSLCCCCCCGGGGGNTQALEQKFAMSERKLRNELTALDKQRADAMEQVYEYDSKEDVCVYCIILYCTFSSLSKSFVMLCAV